MYSPLLGCRNINLRFKQKKNYCTSSMPLLPTNTGTNSKIKTNTSISNKTKNSPNFLSTKTRSRNTLPTNHGSNLSRSSSTSCSNLPSSIYGNHVSTRSHSRDLLSTNTSELDSWDLSRSMESTSSEAKSQEAIQRGVSRLVLLADRCERLNSSLEHVVSESHKILDNSFLSKQVNLIFLRVSPTNTETCLVVPCQFACDNFSSSTKRLT